MPFLDVDSARLAYHDRGAGRPVVLVHGWALSSAAFEPLAADLARDHRVVALDLPGHGDSRDAAPLDLAGLAAAVARLVEHLALEQPVLGGWSLGGQVALAALRRVPRAAGLALLSTTPRFTKGDGWSDGLEAQAVEVLAHRVRRDAARAVARFRDGLLAPGEQDGPAAAALRALPIPPAPALLAGLEVLSTTDLRAALGAVRVPALVVHGGADPICPPGAGRALAAGIPGASQTELPGAGHAPALSRAADVSAAVRASLARLA
jgi:pimeloyl-ACP methyl ester esterase